jgi:uncharacterized protein (DUF2267 family)
MHPVSVMDEIQDVAVPGDDQDRLLAEIDSHARLPAHVSPATAAIVTMRTLAERLTAGQAYDLVRALPAPIRPLFEACMKRVGRPVVKRHSAEVLDEIARHLDVTPAHAELICDGVFRAVRARLPAAIIDHVAMQLPKNLSDLWRGTRQSIADTAAMAETAVRHQLLAEIAVRAPLPRGISAPDALSAVMCIFSHRLSGGEARDVFLGLPDTLRPLLAQCLLYRDELPSVFDRRELVTSVANELGTTLPIAAQIVRVVLAAIKNLLPAREVHDITSQLPPDLRDVWLLT